MVRVMIKLWSFTQTQVQCMNLRLIKTCRCRRHIDTLNGTHGAKWRPTKQQLPPIRRLWTWWRAPYLWRMPHFLLSSRCSGAEARYVKQFEQLGSRVFSREFDSLFKSMWNGRRKCINAPRNKKQRLRETQRISRPWDVWCSSFFCTMNALPISA